MPDDPYQIGDTDSGITLVLSDRGVGVAAAHALSHVDGSDDIRPATASQKGLMSSAYATKLDGVEEGAQLTNPARIALAMGAAGDETPVAADRIGFLDDSATPDLFKTVTLTNFITFLGGSLVNIGGTQAITGTKTFTNAVFTSATINGGSVNGAAITLSGASPNTFIGQLPVASGGTGAATLTGVVKGTGTSALTASAVGLASADVAGTLPVTNGGTGATTLTGVVKGTGTGALTASAVGLASADVTGTLPVTKGGTGATTLTGVVKGTGTGALTASAVGLASADVTGTLPVANGGTGVATLTAGIVRASGTSAFTTGAIALATADVTGVLPIANGGTSFSQLSYGQLSGQSVGTALPITPGFYKVAIATTLDEAANFDNGGAGDYNRLRYTGTQTRKFLVFASTDILSTVAGANFAIKLYKNGSTPIEETEVRANGAGKTGSYLAKLVTSWIIEFAPEEVVELFASAITADVGTPQRMRLIVAPV